MDEEGCAVGWLVAAWVAGILRADNASKKPTKPVRVVMFKNLPPKMKAITPMGQSLVYLSDLAAVGGSVTGICSWLSRTIEK